MEISFCFPPLLASTSESVLTSNPSPSSYSVLLRGRMPRSNDDPIEDGQFDDALENTSQTLNPTPQAQVNLREGHTYVDDENILEWSEESSDEEEDAFDMEEDQMEAEAFETLRAEDEDWEIAERGV